MTLLHSLSSSHPRQDARRRLTGPSARWLVAAAFAIVFLLLAGCDQTGQMEGQPRYDPLSPSGLFPNGQSALNPVPGTVPYASTQSPNSPDITGQDNNGQPLKGWPVTVDKTLVQTGQDQYNIFCIPCHGPAGAGDGNATKFGFPKPPDLLGSSAKSLSNGDIFMIIENGRNKMFSYGYRVKPPERWAIIAYVRAMQLKNGAITPADLTPALIDQIGKQQ